MSNDFIKVKLNRKNIDIFYVRHSIYNNLVKNISIFHGKLLDVGCGKMPYKNEILKSSDVTTYLGLDIENSLLYDKDVRPDILWDGITMPLQVEEFDCAIATEVLEHCSNPCALVKEMNRVLKPGGVIFLTVPFLWPLHEVPNDHYRLTPFILKHILIESGFENIKIESLGGWHASMAQMLGLWIRRAPIPIFIRYILNIIAFPIYKYLIKIDKSTMTFSESTMITGLSVIAYKPLS